MPNGGPGDALGSVIVVLAMLAFGAFALGTLAWHLIIHPLVVLITG